MAGFQSTVNIYESLGTVGDLAFDGPLRASTYNLDSNGQAQTVGFAFTVVSGANTAPSGDSSNAGTAIVGGTGVFAGILSNSKVYSSAGSSGDALAPTLNLPDNTTGELVTMGEIFVALPGAANIGDQVYYDNTTGALGTQADSITGTATQSTTTLTVAAGPTGNIGLGTQLKIAGAEPVTVLAFGTGSGGAGTYTVSVSQTVGSAAAISGKSAAPSGKTLVPNGYVSRYAVTGAGVGVIKLTN